MDNHVTYGSIIKKGIETKGYIKNIEFKKDEPGHANLSSFQEKISFIPKSTFDNATTIKDKMFTIYAPNDIDGYTYTSDSLLSFESLKFTDYDMPQPTTKRYFINRISAGKINLYNFFSLSSTTVPSHPKLLYRKTDDSQIEPKTIEKFNVNKDLADCPKIINRFNSGVYNMVNQYKQSRLSRFVNKQAFGMEMKMHAIQDYNKGVCK